MPAGPDRLLAVLDRSRRLGFLGPGDVEHHVTHADAFVAAVPEAPDRVLDLGSGGGVPGLVLAGRWATTTVVLLDAQGRRTAFLADAVAELGWASRVVVVHGRAEDIGHDPSHRGRYDVVTARSFGPPGVTAECGAPLLRRDGVLLVAEPPAAPGHRWPTSGLAALGLVDDGVVNTGSSTVRRLRAAETTDDRFPRRAGVPERRPLF